ncbi:prohead core protein [Acinetobacter phage KARL-1]|uniref:Prohead core protein n=7 Tax=Lazarusvirus TaxID=2842820 RepID=A0A385IIL6_9CAUD|nr:head scaffolding protein [Acinetobacter phage vB_ApiM_fHyAci03]YP_009881523.1 head scaffolding protein [Acinetobacter phage KARL-1]YP_009886702.1 head scaffolding protein [Acinetobacter phage vB_AbaM_Kimel]YP_009886949.1 head scaffolding protein [Acinetobacter phage vB_AbaM_Lazarus]QGT54188.1 prohead core protein [Acinetobacter phage Stupor]QKE55879.1 prohead core protein [Acinetobacter phage Octan]QKN88118.1 prohead core protein [Acinetobacter phage Abraxas]QNO11298.1 prohead core protei
MLIIVENELVFDNVSNLLPEAQERLNGFSTIFEKDEIVKIVENLAKTEPELAVAIGSLVEDVPLNEFMVKHVSAKGELTKTKDRKTRERNAYQTTGLSKSERRRIARKAVKTKKANPSEQIRTQKKIKRARAKRKSMYGLKP